MGIVLVVFLPVAFAFLYIFQPENYKRIKVATTVFATISAACGILIGFIAFDSNITLISFPFGIDISFMADETSIFFSVVLTVVWYLIAIFSFEYMEHEGDLLRFYSFYILSYCGILGVCFAKNLVTFYMFFEILTFAGYFLIIHNRKQSTFMAGKKYLYYSLFGTGLSIAAIFYLYSFSPDTAFTAGGIESLMNFENPSAVVIASVLAVVGFCVKAGLFPFHSWLAAAHPIAPAPASAALSAVLTKAGVLAALRIIYFVASPQYFIDSKAGIILLILSVITIFLGSTVAMFERYLKKRLAYSSVSQISYALFSLFLFNEFGLYGMFLQVMFHSFAKALLFMNAGVFINKIKAYNIDELDGCYSQLKLPVVTFAVAALSLIGIPFTGGFIAKWQIAIGGLRDTAPIATLGVLIIMLSAIMTAAYLLPPVVLAVYNKSKNDCGEIKLEKTTKIPLVVLASLIIGLGSFFLFFGTDILSRVVNSVIG